MSQETQQLYEFEDFRLDLAERVLFKNGTQLSLTPKAFHLLKILVENHGHIVEKEKLMAEMWTDSFVEEGNLAFNARMLRKALGDDASRPKFIETIPRRGYRFIGEMKPVEPVVALENGSHIEKEKRNVGWMPATALIVVGVGAAAIIAWFAWSKLSGRGAPILETKFSVEKITSSGNVRIAAISPDGKYAAYVDAVGEKQSVWMRQLASGENIQIIKPSDDEYFSLTFSRDGNSLFFVRRPNGAQHPTTLYRVTALGGVPVRILDGAKDAIGVSPDDKQISFVRCEFKPEDFCTLFIADVDGRNERRLLTNPSSLRLEDNQFSPDGKSIAVISGRSFSGSSEMKILEVDVESGATREIASRTFFNIKSLDWLPDGSGLIISAKESLGGKVSFWHVLRGTGETIRLADDPNSYFAVSLSKAGDRMISTQVSNNYRLFFSSGGVDKPLAAARDFAFAPNGKIIYASEDRNIWEINQDGGGQRQLTTDPAIDFSPRVSPDGRYIYFTSNRTGENQVWRMDADGVNQVQITKIEGGYPRYVSANGQEVFYLAGKTQHLWKVDTESGTETEIVSKLLMFPAISPDGKLIANFYRDPHFKIAIMRSDDQQIIKIIEHGDGKSFSFVADWSPDSRTLYFVAEKDDRSVLWQQSLDEETARIAADLGTEGIERFSTAPDGSGFAFTRGKWMHDAVLLQGLK